MIGIIGGSGLEKPEFLKQSEKKEFKTPFGKTSAPITVGKIGKTEVAVLSRHGYRHEYTPSKVPYLANLWALKELGITHILAASACGSLREEIRPGDFVVPSQVIDFSKHRPHSFNHEKGINCHTPFGEPFSKKLNRLLEESLAEKKFRFHSDKTVVTIEGPRFSSRAESNMFRNWECDIINMTTATEATLAKELEIEYSVLATATDYDSWKTDCTPVTYKEVLEIMKQNAGKAIDVFLQTIPKIG
ncbi:MAG: S-methyl-5'-thioadenosine phosphorylase [Candidatus Micrarchaeota archaeon]